MNKLKSIILQKAANNIWLVFSLIFYSILILPLIYSIPHLDGNIDFVKSHFYFKGGFPLYFASFGSIHPPLKVLLASTFFKILGETSFSYNLLGYFLGLAAISGFYFLLKIILGKRFAFLGSTLLALNPLFISTSVFSLIDYMLMVFLFVSLSLYLRKKFLSFSFILTCIILTKETGLLVLALFIFIELVALISRKSKSNISILFYYLPPSLAYIIWDKFLEAQGKTEWGDWIFTDTANQGAFATILHNLITLDIFNIYARQHFLQLLFLNFNWVIILISIVLSFFVLKDRITRKKFFKTLFELDAKSKTIIFIILFCISYALTVLTLQTYTIPRYALPIIPFIILWFSTVVTQLKNFLIKTTVIFVVFLFTILGLFFSIDPIANGIWGKVDVLGEKLYATNYHLSGNDGLTYNYQYLLITKKRTKIIEENTYFPQNYCPYLFPDPNNDRITAEALRFSNSKAAKKCNL